MDQAVLLACTTHMRHEDGRLAPRTVDVDRCLEDDGHHQPIRSRHGEPTLRMVFHLKRIVPRGLDSAGCLIVRQEGPHRQHVASALQHVACGLSRPNNQTFSPSFRREMPKCGFASIEWEDRTSRLSPTLPNLICFHRRKCRSYAYRKRKPLALPVPASPVDSAPALSSISKRQ